MKTKILLAGIFGLLLQIHSQAAYSYNFQDPSLLGQSLSYYLNGDPGQGTDWTTNDLNRNDSLVNDALAGLAPGTLAANFDGHNQVAMFGGGYASVPSTTPVVLWTSLPGSALSNQGFDVKMDLNSSSNGHYDTFGWVFRDSSGSELFHIQFDPKAGTSGTTLEVKYTGWTTGDTIYTVSANGVFDLKIQNDLGTGVFTAYFTNVDVPFSVTGSTLALNAIAQVGATWATNDGASNYGNNVMLFDGLTTDVPEPSTILLTLTGLGALGLWQKNRKRA